MSLDGWLLCVGSHLVLCVVPGPAVLFVLGESMNTGVPGGVRGTAGVVLANALYFFVSVSSFGGLLLSSPVLFTAARWLGAAYLIYVGVQTFRASRFTTELIAERAEDGRRRAVLRGFGVQLANPKAPVFFLVFLPGFVDPSASLIWQVLMVGVPLLLIQATTLIGYTLAAQRVVSWLGEPRTRAAVGGIAGTLLMVFGVIVAATGFVFGGRET